LLKLSWRAPLALQAHRGPRVNRARWDLKALADHRGHKGHVGHKALRGLEGLQALKVRKVIKVHSDRLAHMVRVVHLDRRVQWVTSAQKEISDALGLQERKAARDPRARRVCVVLRENKVDMAPREKRACRDSEGSVELRGQRGRRDLREYRDLPE